MEFNMIGRKMKVTKGIHKDNIIIITSICKGEYMWAKIDGTNKDILVSEEDLEPI